MPPGVAAMCILSAMIIAFAFADLFWMFFTKCSGVSPVSPTGLAFIRWIMAMATSIAIGLHNRLYNSKCLSDRGGSWMQRCIWGSYAVAVVVLLIVAVAGSALRHSCVDPGFEPYWWSSSVFLVGASIVACILWRNSAYDWQC